MKIGYIGLGKMGSNMVERLLEKGHQVLAYNRSKEPVDMIVERGAEGSYSIDELIKGLDGESKKVIWLMVSWQAVDSVIDEILPFLNTGDIVIDGGNSPYFETLKRADKLQSKGINFLDVGVSGGPGGARNGACLMIGGKKEIYQELENLFKDLSIENGYAYLGKNGAGHFVKMVHNGIEYGMMQSLAEGFAILKEAKKDFDFNLSEIAEIYNHGSVIESRLVGWLENALEEKGEDLEGISGEVSHSGEGLWTVETADKLGVKTEIIKKSLDFRVESKGNPSYTGKVVSALRNQFGGHDVGEKV